MTNTTYNDPNSKNNHIQLGKFHDNKKKIASIIKKIDNTRAKVSKSLRRRIHKDKGSKEEL